MAPGSILNISIYIYFTFSAFTFCSYKQKYQKYKLSSLSDLTFVSDHKGIDNPLSCWLRSSYLFVQVRGTRAWSPTGLNLGSQKLREILTLLCCITLSSSRKYNARSRSSKKNFWRRCRGGLRKSHIPSTYHKPLSFALHLFASRFPLPHFTLAILFALLPPCVYRSLASCLLVCVACLN